MLSFPLAVKAVTIDLDGTLLDTIPDLAAAANMMLAKLGRPPLAIELIRTFVGKGIVRLVERTLAGDVDGVPDAALMARALPIFERHYVEVNGRHTTVYPGVKEGLERMREQGFPLACVTNKSARFTLPLLDEIGLARYFRTVVSGDTLARKKPDPDPLLYAATVLEIAPREMLMIGDSLNDTQAARAAGCPVFCVTYGYNEGHDVRDLDADAVVDSLVDAAVLIEKA
ncbi:MAG: phosphoglycolate phosphatase [Betaproteobacteria bacterium]|nr:phosphoglycolate phosphatase [Betaproteobacteria bacterium]